MCVCVFEGTVCEGVRVGGRGCEGGWVGGCGGYV